jgi:hypothetical protein
MSSDNVNGGGLSVITRSTGQLGPRDERLVLGPIRFANHECVPNCQVNLFYFFPNDRLPMFSISSWPSKAPMHTSLSPSKTSYPGNPFQCHTPRMDIMSRIKNVSAVPASPTIHLSLQQRDLWFTKT